MKKILKICGLVLGCVLLAGSCFAYEVSGGNREQAKQVVEVVNRYYATSQSKNLRAYGNLFVFSGKAQMGQRLGTAAELWRMYDLINYQVDVKEVSFSPEGGTALVRYVAATTHSNHKGERKKTSNEFIALLYQQQGVWKLADINLADEFFASMDQLSILESVAAYNVQQEKTTTVKKEITQAGCRTLAQVYTDGSGDRYTKKLGGNYAGIRLDSLRNDQTIRVEAVSGRLTYVTLHARYQGGYWRTIYKGPKTEFPVGQYIASYKKDRNCTHVNVSVNGAHEKYDPVACKANLLVCSAPDKPGPKKIAEDEKKMLANLSLGKPARQSSTGYGGAVRLAVDGNTDGNYFSGSTTHTNHEKNPWWEVDLGAVYKLENVLVYNRIDSCSERLDNFQVLVSVKPFPNSPVTANNYTIKGWTVQKAQNINRINLGKTHGRYVRIQLLGENYLSLAEVIVNGISTETHPMGTETDTTVELSNAQKKLLVLEQLYKEAYERYQDSIRKMGTRHPATQQAFEKYELLVKIYEQVKQEYIQSNQGRGGSLSSGREVITAKMRKDVLSQLTQEAYQRYQDSLKIRGINHFATQRAFDQYRWLFDINRQVN